MSYAKLLRGSNRGIEEVRRDLHRHPETAFHEFRTASLAAATLDELGYRVATGAEVMRADRIIWPPNPEGVATARDEALASGADPAWVARMDGGLTGVVATLDRGPGPALAFRFDMDALPVTETADPGHLPNREGFASLRPGRMHACGHDGHTAIGLALAARLAADPGWRGRIKLIFQPAEEGGRGAVPMIEAGVCDDVDWLFMAHLGCLLPSGQIAAQAVDFLSMAKFDVRFHGTAAHAAMGPQNGGNALLAGAAATLALHAIARHGSAATFINVGRMVSGTARNIVADDCLLEVDLRGETPAAREYMLRRAEECLRGAALTQGVEVEIDHGPGLEGNSNSPEAAAAVTAAAAQVAGVEKVVPEWPIGGGDDGTFLIRRVQERGGKAGYFLIGSDIAAIHHAAGFDFDESSLLRAVDLFAAITGQILGSQPRPDAMP